MKKNEADLPTRYQHHAFLIPASGIEYIALALFVIACLLFPVGFSIAQDADPADPPTAETQAPESTDQTEEEGSGSERLNPETDVPEEGMVIGDGDDLAMVDNFVQIHGNALIKFEDVILRADHIWADFDDNLMRASGNVHLKMGNEDTYSDELIFNLDTKKGIARNGFTFSDPWYFGGSEIFKIEEDRSYIRGASLTTCSLKYPHYYFSVSEVIVRKDQEMIAKNIVLRIGGFPLFYFPVMRRDLRKGKIAKIIVKIGTDSYQGPNISIILPVARKRRYDGALLYDRSSKRGQGFGFEGKYRFNDAQFQEIYIPIPPDVTPNQRTKLKEKADELQDRLDGEYDRYWLRQIFIEYKITDDDVSRAKEKAEEVLKQLQEEGADFAQIAQSNSDHFDTRYDGGDLGFLALGEVDEEGNPKLDPVLEEAAFALQEGEISSVVQTESAFHIFKAERVIDVYGEREIKLSRIDIAITASEDTEFVLRELADDMLERAHEGEPFEQLIQVPDQFADIAEPTLSEPNEGEGLLLNEMESSWRSAVRRLENPGDVIERRPITMPEGLYIFQLIEKEETPTFEALAEQFEAEWDAFYEDVMNPKPEKTEEDGESQDTTGEAVSDQQSAVDKDTDDASSLTEGFQQPMVSDSHSSESRRLKAEGDTPNTDENQSAEQTEVDDTDENQSVEQDGSENEAGGETTSDQSDDEVASEDPTTEEDAEDEDELKVYRKHGFRGRWEDPSAVASDAQRLYAGEYSSRPIQTKKSFRLIKVDKKRTYRGDIYFYGADRYSYERQSATRIGRRWNMRWGHTQSFYTPWDNREEGRRPINFTGRTELQARNFKEELKLPGESRLNTFGILTYGTGLSTVSDTDRDENGNPTFSRETIGDITSRLEVRHVHDFTGEGTTSLQKLPQFSMNFSRIRVSALPLFKNLNDGMETIAEKFKTETPILSLFTVPTLESTSFDLDIELGNFFREVYKGKFEEERDVFLQTMDLGFDIRKQSTLLITPLRELQMSLDLNTNMVWHDQDQEKNRNIVKGIFSFNGSATNTLFRVFNVDYIPGLRKLRHEIQSSLRFNYQPPVDEDENLYPFGPSTYFYERKRLTYNFNTNFEIKTRRSQSAHRIFYFDTRLTADFTEFDPLYRRKYEPIESDFTFVPLPSRNLNMTVRFTHDPNPHPDDGKQFKMVGFRTNIRYTRPSWNISIGNSFSKRHTSRRTSRSVTATGRYRFSQDLEFNVSLIYYPIEGQFYSQRISMTRNLHDWNLRISWNRVGIKREDSPYNNVRQDFTFQVNLIQEPAVSMGVGYDATTETWGLRTVPAGVPYNAFGAGSSLGRSYF
ncbi:MAG: peptidylprolyl isomerase [Candidatus Poribacteria bacterium]|nr:peptidylprolyl isomerase [Candidatus Poribacteria bacterium]